MKAESQVTITLPSQELMGAGPVIYNMTGTPEQRYQHSQARVQSLTMQGIISSNAEWLGDTFSGELDIGDLEGVAD